MLCFADYGLRGGLYLGGNQTTLPRRLTSIHGRGSLDCADVNDYRILGRYVESAWLDYELPLRGNDSLTCHFLYQSKPRLRIIRRWVNLALVIASWQPTICLLRWIEKSKIFKHRVLQPVFILVTYITICLPIAIVFPWVATSADEIGMRGIPPWSPKASLPQRISSVLWNSFTSLRLTHILDPCKSRWVEWCMTSWDSVFWSCSLHLLSPAVSINCSGIMRAWKRSNVKRMPVSTNTVPRISTSISQSQSFFDTNTSIDQFGLSSLFESLQTLFWGTFGLIDLQTFQIYKKHTFTMFIGLLMFGVYSSIMIIVLLNMLIAMMSSSYQYIAVRNSALLLTCWLGKFADPFRIQRKLNGSLLALNCGSVISKKGVLYLLHSTSSPVLNPFGTRFSSSTGVYVAVRRNIWEIDGKVSRSDTFRTPVPMIRNVWTF